MTPACEELYAEIVLDASAGGVSYAENLHRIAVQRLGRGYGRAWEQLHRLCACGRVHVESRGRFVPLRIYPRGGEQ